MSKTLTSIFALAVFTFSTSPVFATNTDDCYNKLTGHTWNIFTVSGKCGQAKGAYNREARGGADQSFLDSILAKYSVNPATGELYSSSSSSSYSSSTGAKQVPELSASAAPISIALVGGLLAFGLERRRKQNKK